MPTTTRIKLCLKRIRLGSGLDRRRGWPTEQTQPGASSRMRLANIFRSLRIRVLPLAMCAIPATAVAAGSCPSFISARTQIPGPIVLMAGPAEQTGTSVDLPLKFIGDRSRGDGLIIQIDGAPGVGFDLPFPPPSLITSQRVHVRLYSLSPGVHWVRVTVVPPSLIRTVDMRIEHAYVEVCVKVR